MSPAKQKAPPAVQAPLQRRPRPNVERRQEGRARLLVAAVETLIERGYGATTVACVQERAGVSRGAVLHYFPTKAEMLVDAVEYLADAQIAELNKQAATYVADPDGSFASRVTVWLDLVWSCFASRLFMAVLELWVASRTEPGLRQHVIPYERRLGASLRELSENLFPGLVPETDFRIVYDATLVYYRGLAVSGLLGIGGAEQDELRDVWAMLITQRSA